MSELLEKILSKDNINVAYKRVCANRGAGGVDEVTIEELGDYIKKNWDRIEEQIRNRKYRPHQDSVKKFKDRLKELTCRKMPGTVTSKIEKINQVTRGWINYYAPGSMKTAMTEIDAHLRTRLRVIIWKQWKVPGKRQWGLQKLGVGKDLARLTAYCGDRYYWVATKTCVVRAISKDVLTKAGLISCLDYYNERHALKLC